MIGKTINIDTEGVITLMETGVRETQKESLSITTSIDGKAIKVSMVPMKSFIIKEEEEDIIMKII